MMWLKSVYGFEGVGLGVFFYLCVFINGEFLWLFYFEWDIYLIIKYILLERYLVVLCLVKIGKVLCNVNSIG